MVNSALAVALLGVIAVTATDLTPVLVPFSKNADTNVTDITSFDQLRDLMRTRVDLHIILVYDSVDINTQRVARVWDTAAGSLKGFAKFSALDVHTPGLEWLADAWEIRAIPFVKCLPPQLSNRKQFAGTELANVGGVKQIAHFDERDFTVDSIRKFTFQFLPEHFINKIDSDRKLEFLQRLIAGSTDRGKLPATVVLFTEKDSTSQLYRGLANKFYIRLHFAEVSRAKAPKVLEHFKVKKLPTLMVLAPGDLTGQIYSGKLDILEISQFLEGFAEPMEELEKKQIIGETKIIERVKRLAQHGILELQSAEEWKREVLDRQTFIAVAFLDPESPEFKSRMDVLKQFVAKKVRSAVTHFFWVNKVQQQALYTFFAGEDSDEGDFLFFLSMRKKVQSRLVGSYSVAGLEKYVSQTLADAVGARSLKVDAIPPFQ